MTVLSTRHMLLASAAAAAALAYLNFKRRRAATQQGVSREAPAYGRGGLLGRNPHTLQSLNEPALARRSDLVLLGYLLESRLAADAQCPANSGLASIWRDHVVPLAVRDGCEWQLGMTAAITGLKSEAGAPFNGLVGRISDAVGERWELLVDGVDGVGTVCVKSTNLKAAADVGAVIATWRRIPNRYQTQEPYALGSPVHEAVREGDPAKLWQLMRSAPPELSAVDAEGRTPLHLALEQLEERREEERDEREEQPVPTDVALVGALLLAPGTHVNARDRRQRTPLHAAISMGLQELVPMLLEAHADPTMDCQGNNALHLAAIQGDASTIRLLLSPTEAAGTATAPLDVCGCGKDSWTPLGLAARANKLAAAQALVELGADPNAATRSDGKSALDVARSNGREAMVRLLTPSKHD